MYPDLHDRVIESLSSISPPILPKWDFHPEDTDAGTKQDYDTRIMGDFTCPNKACKKHGWGSKKIAIVIREYPGRWYNAVVYGQRCKSCDTLGIIRLDEQSYVERVVYRLKKWSGMKMGGEGFRRQKGPDHEHEFCEGCKAGRCSWGNDMD
ncbi:zinc-binding domain-containing protein [Dichotomopilus funicola]|uniref:Zinc-binding domain-containing protein n=1 Tax=Dichotomopilus funicola TaxID=1934379 RepID=A0AAN6UUF1_9PEZI|nr:zinc-binding domain-containing protein [Dichotomopilus funicola]